MKKRLFFVFFSCLFSAGLAVVSCGGPSRQFGTQADGGMAGGGGDGEIAESGGSLGTGGAGATPSAGVGAGSLGGGDNPGGAAGADGSGASSGSEGAPDCSAQEKVCGGVCVEISDPTYGCDPTLCSTSGCPDIPGAELACQAGQCVLGSCGAGTKECTQQCVSITDPAFGCDATSCDALACPSQATGGTVVCEGSACVIDTCPTNYKECGNRCVAVSDPTYGCGATTCDADACPDPGTGTLVCQGSACVIGACGAGTKKCGDKCVTTDANNGCAEPARCTACANNEACQGSPATCQCVPTAMATACAGKCGSVSNGCGGTHACGGCTSPQTCGGGGTANVCGCTPTAMGTACSGKNCGTVSNGCGGTHTCGTCTLPQTCAGGGTANVCGCTPTAVGTACSGKNCGTVPNGCGGTHTCGTCTLPESCAGGGTANVCGCTPTAMATACSGKNCGTAPNGCGGNYTCGTCSSPSAPICVNSTCEQCAVFSDCPSGSFDCSNNLCTCRTPDGPNVIKDGGFDTADAFSSWTTSNQPSWGGDVDLCPQSGSMVFTGTISRCFQIPLVSGTVEHSLGFHYKSADGGGCLGFFYVDAGCTQSGGTADFLNLSWGDSLSWTSTVAQANAQNGTRSVLVECNATTALTMDQIYLRPTGTIPGAGF